MLARIECKKKQLNRRGSPLKGFHTKTAKFVNTYLFSILSNAINLIIFRFLT